MTRLAFILAMPLAGWLLAGETSPSTPPSIWVVEQVRSDPATDNASKRYFLDDPRLVGRRVILASRSAELDDGSGKCAVLARRVVWQTPNAALATHLYRRGARRSSHPTPANLGLKSLKKFVPVTSYRCAGPGDVPPGRIWTGSASFPLPNGRLALIWQDEIVMVLAPASRVQASQPNFSCAVTQPRTSEQKICSDPGLAAWDRSVAKAYAWARDGSAEIGPVQDVDALIREQRVWIAGRNACGTNRTCLLEQMAGRVSALLNR
jgi:uncharacterized protein YecT (DUF1311 family)